MKRSSLIGCATHSLILAFLLFAVRSSSLAHGQKPAKPEKPNVETQVHATIETSLGSFEVELFPNDAPKAVENFVKLAEKKYFDGTRVHRVSRPAGLIQMGDEKSKDTTKAREWGTGGKSIWGKEFQDELDPRSVSYKAGYMKGVLAMANHGPNTNSSQFFIMIRDAQFMPRNYTIFGKVVEGLEVIDSIGGVEIIPQMGPNDGKPKGEVVLKKVTIRKEPVANPIEKAKK